MSRKPDYRDRKTPETQGGRTVTQPEHDAAHKMALQMLDDGLEPGKVLWWLRCAYASIERVFA